MTKKASGGSRTERALNQTRACACLTTGSLVYLHRAQKFFFPECSLSPPFSSLLKINRESLGISLYRITLVTFYTTVAGAAITQSIHFFGWQAVSFLYNQSIAKPRRRITSALLIPPNASYGFINNNDFPCYPLLVLCFTMATAAYSGKGTLSVFCPRFYSTAATFIEYFSVSVSSSSFKCTLHPG